MRSSYNDEVDYGRRYFNILLVIKGIITGLGVFVVIIILISCFINGFNGDSLSLLLKAILYLALSQVVFYPVLACFQMVSDTREIRSMLEEIVSKDAVRSADVDYDYDE